MSRLTRGKDDRGHDIIIAEECKIGYTNFAGREVKTRDGKVVNAEGARNFTFDIDNEEDLNLLREESVNVKLLVNDIGDESAYESIGSVRPKVKPNFDPDPRKQSPVILIRSGIKDENGNYVEKFRKYNVNRLAELDKLSFDAADFIFGISRRNDTHALYLNKAWLTTTYSPNPLDLKYAGMYDDDEDEEGDDIPVSEFVDTVNSNNMDEEMPF